MGTYIAGIISGSRVPCAWRLAQQRVFSLQGGWKTEDRSRHRLSVKTLADSVGQIRKDRHTDTKSCYRLRAGVKLWFVCGVLLTHIQSRACTSHRFRLFQTAATGDR